MMGATGLLVLVCASCSSGGANDDEGADRAPQRTAHADDDETTTTTAAADEPSAATPADVVPYLEDLLARYDDAVNTIVADPSIATDRDDPTVDGFLGLFEEGSPFASGSLDGWASQASEGVSLEPIDPDQGVNTTTLEGPPTRIDDDTVLFGQCTVQSYVVLRNGDETRREDRKLLPGSGQAVRVGGHWVLQELTTPPDAQGCITHGGAP